MPEVKGVIHAPQRATQLRDYSGLLFGNITPTDIDGLIEYKNIGYVIIELKYRDTEILKGQKLALARMNDDFELAGKASLCIIASHFQEDCSKAIDVANTHVTAYRYRKRWRTFRSVMFTRDLIVRFFKSDEIKRREVKQNDDGKQNNS